MVSRFEDRTRTLQQRESKLCSRRKQARHTQLQQQPRDTEIAKHTRCPKQQSQPQRRQPHMPQQKPQNPVRQVRLRLRLQQLFTTRLQQLPILHTRRTHLLARAATETTIDMRAKRVGSILQSSFRNRAHQVEPAAWSIILVACDHIRRTRLETQATVNTSEQFLFLSGEWGHGFTGVNKALVTYRQTVTAARVGSSETHARLLFDHDPFRIAEITQFPERVAARR